MTRTVIGLAIVIALASQRVPTSTSPQTCAEAWPKSPGPNVDVKNIGELERAVRGARSGSTIWLADGEYLLREGLRLAVPNLTLRGKSGDAQKVVIRGHGMVNDSVGVGISADAAGATVTDLTVRDVGFHAVQVRGENGASNFALYRARLMDTGQQLLKASVSNDRTYSDNGLVACSEFSYTTSAPSDYTNGIDLLATKAWVIRDNRLLRIRGPESRGWQSGPAILIWKAAEDTTVERNVIIDSFRGIAFGLQPGPSDLSRNGPHDYDHLGGVIRNNVVVNLNAWADEAIEANAARDVRIEHNSVLVEGTKSPWSIGVRFPMAFATIRNNLTNQQILLRNGGRADQQANLTNATRAWFVDALRGNLHLVSADLPAVDAGLPLAKTSEDFDRIMRPQGRAPDLGAFEFRIAPRNQ